MRMSLTRLNLDVRLQGADEAVSVWRRNQITQIRKITIQYKGFFHAPRALPMPR
jgi:hypothetical protein